LRIFSRDATEFDSNFIYEPTPVILPRLANHVHPFLPEMALVLAGRISASFQAAIDRMVSFAALSHTESRRHPAVHNPWLTGDTAIQIAWRGDAASIGCE